MRDLRFVTLGLGVRVSGRHSTQPSCLFVPQDMPRDSQRKNLCRGKCCLSSELPGTVFGSMQIGWDESVDSTTSLRTVDDCPAGVRPSFRHSTQRVAKDTKWAGCWINGTHQCSKGQLGGNIFIHISCSSRCRREVPWCAEGTRIWMD